MAKDFASHKGGVFALGNFDGVHLGHQGVVRAALDQAHKMNVKAKVLTFEPHPRSVFSPESEPFRLTPWPSKKYLLKSLGIDEIIAQDFTPEFAKLSAEDFVKKILIETYGAEHLIGGHDFVFGRGRAGNMQMLKSFGVQFGIGVTEVIPLTGADKAPLSSTIVRSFLRSGELSQANKILGRDWSLSGVVIEGAKRGRTIGIPTANIALGEYLRPKFGVYAVNASRFGDTKIVSGVANIGLRPTLNGQLENLEAHLFSFDEDIYGQMWSFSLRAFLRPEQKFENFEDLSRQIRKDIAAAKAL